MALRVKIPCMCTDDWYVNNLRPELKDHPYLCVFCKGEKEFGVDVSFDAYAGEFKAPEKWFEDYQDGFWVGFKCPCGDDISMSGGGYIACSCGRVYQLSISLTVDEAHIGDTQFLIDEYHRDNKRILDKYTKKDDTV